MTGARRFHSGEVLESHIRAQWGGGVIKAGKRAAI